jgi:acetyl-CoA carboxylase beta subunit
MRTNTIEDQHIWELEQSRRVRLLEATTATEKRQLKELHWIQCPKCGQKLTAEEHGSVEIDVCPNCRGLWLDATELETIVASESGFLLSCLRTLRGH